MSARAKSLVLPTVSLLIPCRNEEAFIEKLLQSIENQDYPKDKLEALIIDGESTDRTKSIVQSWCERHINIKLLNNPHRHVPQAMNLGIAKSVGEVILRLDAHSKYPENYCSKLVHYLYELKADNVGACWITATLNDNPQCKAIRAVLSHPFGVGNSYFRIGAGSPKKVDTVPFGCYKRELLEKIGGYNEALIRNQDIELNKRIIARKGSIYLVPEVTCTYFAREKYKDLAINNFRNGMWNILTVYITKDVSTLSLRHFVPLCFVLSLILPLLFTPVNLWFGAIAALSLLAYLFIIISVSFRLRMHGVNFFYAALTFFVLHFSYGVGSIAGIFRIGNLFGAKRNSK